MEPSLELTVVDSFTDRPFSGNPAAIAVVGAFPADERMQQIAREMNLSETSFLVARNDGSYDLRWFTPSTEVDLCGHATLAAAHVLGGAGVFHTASGVLTCTDGGDGWIDMDFPADPVTPADPPADLGADVKAFGQGRTMALVELRDAATVRSFEPDLDVIASLAPSAVIITAEGDHAGIDCVSRVFGPNLGIPEDPVTGSAHCTLASHWSDRLGRDELTGEQASARGGIVRMRVRGDRVVLGGRAVTVSKVTLLA
ncbi:MAG TPA: PhzF family phenazine biosynthesis protein [Acidimicrobiales bacterium]|nr:PhzF family phenazine biosynthesis protein [Acidimicrobiales bacterium]